MMPNEDDVFEPLTVLPDLVGRLPTLDELGARHEDPVDIVDDLPGDPATAELRARMTEWVDQVVTQETERRERGLEAQVGIIAASSHNAGRALDFDGDELTLEDLEESMRLFRERYYQPDYQLADWQLAIIEAMIEGRTIYVSRGRVSGWRRLGEYLQSIGFVAAGDLRIEGSPLPDGVAMIDPGEDARHDALMTTWLGYQANQRAANLDESTSDADRARWANTINNEPTYQADNSGGSLSSDELLEAIGMAVDEWKDVRDG